MASAREKLAAVKAAILDQNWVSIGKPQEPDGEWFKSPSSTEFVQHLVAFRLPRNSSLQFQMMCALRNEQIETFSTRFWQEHGLLPEQVRTLANWPVSIRGSAGGPTCGFRIVKLTKLSPLTNQSFSELDRLRSGSLSPDEDFSPEQVVGKVLATIKNEFEPEFAKVTTLRELYDVLVAGDSMWPWWMSNAAVRIAQIFALGSQLSITKKDLVEIAEIHRSAILASLPSRPNLFENYMTELSREADRFRLH